jgi:hypothetical protein
VAKPKKSALPLTAAGTLPKADVLDRWRPLPAGRPIAMAASPADATGSSYEGDSIRLTGSLRFLDSMLSNLRSLLRLENTKTRLSIAYAQQKDRLTKAPVPDKYVVYLKVVEKARTTRARAPAAPAPPARARPRAATPPAPVVPAAPPAAVAEALEALLVLGQKRPEAERRLAQVVAAEGPGLDGAAYVRLALKLPLAKK